MTPSSAQIFITNTPAGLVCKSEMKTSSSQKHAPVTTPAYDFAVTPEELTAAKELQSEFDRLQQHAASLYPDGLRFRWNESVAAYSAAPTDSNFASMKTAALERDFFRRFNQLRSIANDALKHFIQDSVQVWARPIIDRALASARAALGQVEDEERARHALKGAPLHHSDIIEAARSPVLKLEQEMGFIDQGAMSLSPDRILRVFNIPPTSLLVHVPKPSIHNCSTPNWKEMSVKELTEVIIGRGWIGMLPNAGTGSKADLIDILERRVQREPVPTGKRGPIDVRELMGMGAP
jgi:hypothetical protein